MRGITESMVPPSAILGGKSLLSVNDFDRTHSHINLLGFSWSQLDTGAIVVDVGSGVGAASLVLSKAHPKLHVILQDEQQVIDKAKSVS